MAGKDRQANGSAADDAEFEKLLDEMDELGRQADALRAKVNHLIDEMRENDVPPDEETDEEADGGAADEEADEVAADIAVNGHDESGRNSGEVDVEKTTEIEAGDGDVAMDTDNEAAGEAIDGDGDPDAT